jgi:transcriptional regulator with XRE-family HTH domain
MAARTSLIDDYIGKQLKIARVIRNLSQDELARKVGVTFQQIQKYEKGLNRISASRLYWLMKILGVDYNFFFGGIDQIVAQSEFLENGLNSSLSDVASANNGQLEINFDSKEVTGLLRSYFSIKSPEARNKILALIKVIEE